MSSGLGSVTTSGGRLSRTVKLADAEAARPHPSVTINVTETTPLQSLGNVGWAGALDHDTPLQSSFALAPPWVSSQCWNFFSV